MLDRDSTFGSRSDSRGSLLNSRLSREFLSGEDEAYNRRHRFSRALESASNKLRDHSTEMKRTTYDYTKARLSTRQSRRWSNEEEGDSFAAGTGKRQFTGSSAQVMRAAALRRPHAKKADHVPTSTLICHDLPCS